MLRPRRESSVTTKAQNIANLTEQRSMAMLVSFARQLAVTAQDDSLDVLDMLIRDLLAHSVNAGKSEFSHVSEGRSRLDDLPISICAVLLAEACNIGLTPMIRAGIPALERDRLLYVQQNYIRPDTLSRANACLVDYQAQIPLAQAWGGGEVASADGLRFVVPLKTLNAGPNTKYFGTGRGITLVNYTSDQFSGFKNIVVTGTLRDSLVVLEGLLNQEAGLNSKELMTDTTSYTNVIFGLFHVLGYQFSPRLADLGESRFWRMDASADYGVLNGLAHQTIVNGMLYIGSSDKKLYCFSLPTS